MMVITHDQIKDVINDRLTLPSGFNVEVLAQDIMRLFWGEDPLKSATKIDLEAELLVRQGYVGQTQVDTFSVPVGTTVEYFEGRGTTVARIKYDEVLEYLQKYKPIKPPLSSKEGSVRVVTFPTDGPGGSGGIGNVTIEENTPTPIEGLAAVINILDRGMADLAKKMNALTIAIEKSRKEDERRRRQKRRDL